MIQNYLEFNVARFVRDCYERKAQLLLLIEELREINGARGIDPSKDKVQASRNDDAMVNLVMLRSRLSDKIRDYKNDIRLLQSAMETLTPDEKEAIDICFNGKNIARQCQEKFIEAHPELDFIKTFGRNYL